ncbi:MAG: 1-acyl-sn-glycerol-3-phosphate acyltransferase [Candidatus Aminicenantes bacterium]|nr:MAG: 1-acyl-sn-glycerol-3-phosphate acyltransferase [Candidatus Aminicenantes bacterium]
MKEIVSLPLWLVIVGGALAVWALLDHLLLPSVRWYFRRRVNIVINQINKRLDVRLPAFELTKRRVIIDRLIYDNEVVEAAKEYSQEQGVPNEVAMEKVKRYANEIVPSFNAYVYFRLGNWLSRSLLRLLYRVRVGSIDEEGLAKVDPQSSVVFVMNHRSNLDYILLACLAINRVAMSFAVGEWARVWPLQQLIRVLGGYFVRRGSGDTLYRSVLARYVQMATEGGVVQAIFPEGRLTKDGRLGDPRIGLLDYMLRSFDSKKGRDLVFIPVGVNYDRVLEDRSSLLSLDKDAPRKSRVSIIKTTLLFIIHNLWLMLRGGWYRYGYTVVSFGTPVSMRLYAKRHNIDFRNPDKKARIENVQLLAQDLMQAVGRTIPVTPVSLVSSVFVENPDKTFSEQEIKARVQSLISEFEEKGALVYIPRSDQDYTVEVGLRMLTLRHLVLEENDQFRAAPEEIKLLQYYVSAISHHI